MKEKISIIQFNMVTFGFIVGNSIIYSFGLNYAQRETWIADLIGLLIGVGVIFMITYIVNKYPLGSFDLILEHLFGSVLAKVFLFIIFMYAFFTAAMILSHVDVFMNNTIMPETPGWVFNLSLGVVTAIIIRYGVETVSRCSELFGPMILIFIIILGALAIPQFDLKYFSPLFTEDISSIMKAVVPIASFPYLQAVLLVFFMVLINKKTEGNTYKLNILGLVLGGIILISRSIYKIGIFGVREATKLTFPFYSISRQIEVGSFLQRTEILFLGVWCFAIFIKLAVCLYVCAKCMQGIFKLEDYKILALPITLLAVPFSLNLFNNFQGVQLFLNVTLIFINIILIVIPFSIIFGFSLFKKKVSA
ncbi:spore germination protein (amino acid permease) [Desulfonispora thiosulfatigenes DSM 11270]|uniref:Spore germination protein (Amino acid permease) n=1 Tax=Desulfonispora thiosulfatigenes DSM 11270 TaxID=656914 RepID=A0A1W1V407_DESTI|nr:endospore germination permease [Desulfonispora thiosulfatigenes]SMB88016.1 spore germination protein (amino acid permease) [Desulfonispora thiosulfatigenes DSM 11270]